MHIGNQKFKCDTCGQAFDILRQLTEHAAVHRVDKPFTCSICNKSYSRSTVLSQHMKSHTSTNTNPVNYANNANVNTIPNVQVKQMENIVPMAVMTKTTTVTVPIMTQQPLYKCQQCETMLMTPTALKEHESIHIAVQKEDKKLITVKEVMVMVKPDTESQIIQLMPSSQIKCYACNEMFNTEQERNEHAVIHNNRLLTHDTNQTLSSVQVSNTQSLNPIQTTTIIDQPPEVPSLSFPDVEPMYEEIQTGPKFMDLDSTKCVRIIKPDDEFIRNNSDGNDKFKCKLCNKQFSILSNYNFHLRVHKRDKPHRCLVCAKSFRLSKSLEQHMVLHTETLSFHCFVCNRIFSRSSALKMHLRSHTTAEIQAPNRTYVDVLCHDADDDLFANEDEENNVSLDYSHLDVPICDICGIKFDVCGNTRVHTCPKYNANDDDEFDDDDEENLTAMDIWNCD